MRNESIRQWLVPGALLGIVAGVAFALFEMLAAWGMGDGFWMPLRMIGAIVLGEEALQASYSLPGAAAAGAVIHLALSAVFGAGLGLVAALVRGLTTSRGVLVAAGSLYGLALWLVNFYAIAPVAFEWFQDADPLVQFVAHTFVFGTLLGALLALRLPARVPARLHLSSR
jgi:hypothetical protein